MKNEDRIVELLAESLRKLDQHSGLLGKVVDVLITFGNSFNKLTGTLGDMSSTLISIDGRLESMDGRLGSMDGRLESMDGRLGSMDRRLGDMDDKLGSMDNRLSSMDHNMSLQYGLLQNIDGKVDVLKEHEKRISRLEEKVFKNK